MLSVSPRGLTLRNPHALGNNSHNYTSAINFHVDIRGTGEFVVGEK